MKVRSNPTAAPVAKPKEGATPTVVAKPMGAFPGTKAKRDEFGGASVDRSQLRALANELGPLGKIGGDSLAANVHALDAGPFLSAGKNQFKSLWTRDFCWSIKGLLASGRSDVVKNQLGTVLAAIRSSDGQLPRTLDTMDPKKRVMMASLARVLPFLHAEQPLKGKLHAEYEDQNGQIAIDGNALAILGTLDYAAKTGDTAFVDAHRSELVKAFHFYDGRMKNGLVAQPPFSDWQDSVKREGATLYTNLLYQSLLERLQGQPGFESISPKQVSEHREKMEAAFFDAKTGMYKSVEGQPQTSLDGNLLAIELGYLKPDSARAQEVYGAIKASPFWTRAGTPGFVSYPPYKAEDRSLSVKLVGLGHYHDELQWSWLMAMSGKVAAQMGDVAGARASLTHLQGLAQRDGGIGEIYQGGAKSKPFSNLLYRSEQPFSWGAAATVDAVSFIKAAGG